MSPDFEKLLMPHWGLYLIGGGKVSALGDAGV